ncbi:MAG: DMT family transporter [Acidimicrobiia bacterium]
MRRNPWAPILLASLGWGTGGVATRVVLIDGIDPLTLVAVRFLLATTVLMAVGALLARRPPPSREAWRRGAVLGVLNMAGPTLFLTPALQHVSAGLGGLLVALVPLATLVSAHFLLDDERFERTKLAGLMVSLAGVGVLLWSGDTGLGDGGNLLWGVGLSLVGVALAGLGGALSRKYVSTMSAYELVLPQFVGGTLLAWVVALPVLRLPEVAGVDTWAAIVYLALASTIIPFASFLWAVQLTTATKASLVGYLVPLVGVVGGVLVLSEQVTGWMLVGGWLILAGVVMVDRVDRRRPVVPAPV